MTKYAYSTNKNLPELNRAFKIKMHDVNTSISIYLYLHCYCYVQYLIFNYLHKKEQSEQFKQNNIAILTIIEIEKLRPSQYNTEVPTGSTLLNLLHVGLSL